MADYELFYWPVPFRGQFIRAILAHAGKSWTEADPTKISEWMSGPLAEMPIPFVGPPVLVDTKTGFALAQMPAIAYHLGETLGLMPPAMAQRALAMKVVNDANDVIDELTLDGGKQMWTPASWEEFVPRLERWMLVWEDTGRRHGLSVDRGFLLGTEEPTLADVVTAVLWGTMTDRFRVFGDLLERTAPVTAALTRRIAELPPLAALAAKARDDYGDSWCGGQIEASLRKVLGSWVPANP